MKRKVGAALMISAAVVFSVSVLNSIAPAPAEDLSKATGSQLDASRLTYARLYCTPGNESHFGEQTAELAKQNFAPPAASIYIGGDQPASRVSFAGFEAHWGRSRPGEPSLPSHSRSSAVYCGPGCILDHDDRWRNEAATYRRRGPSRRRRTMQRAHYRSGRHHRFPGFRSLTLLIAGADHPELRSPPAKLHGDFGRRGGQDHKRRIIPQCQ